MFALQVIGTIVFLILSLFCIISVFSLIRTFIKIRGFDELQKNTVYKSLSLSFLIIMGIHLIQLVMSILTPEPYSLLAKFIISPGSYNSALMTNSPLHFDSFLIDNIILGIVYYARRKKYGLI